MNYLIYTLIYVTPLFIAVLYLRNLFMKYQEEQLEKILSIQENINKTLEGHRSLYNYNQAQMKDVKSSWENLTKQQKKSYSSYDEKMRSLQSYVVSFIQEVYQELKRPDKKIVLDQVEEKLEKYIHSEPAVVKTDIKSRVKI